VRSLLLLFSFLELKMHESLFCLHFKFFLIDVQRYVKLISY